jgi:hypothetical protein
MYKFSNPQHTAVRNLETGTTNICPGVWMWGQYQEWVVAGGITLPYDDRTPQQIAADTLAKTKADIAAQRYEMETGGVVYEGMTILTDRESAQILDSTVEKIRRGLMPTIYWKCPEGYLALTAANVDVIEIAVLTHIQTAFAWEKAQLEAL